MKPVTNTEGVDYIINLSLIAQLCSMEPVTNTEGIDYISQVIKYIWGDKVCNINMCTIQVKKVGLRLIVYYMLTAPFKLKVDVKSTWSC